MISHQFSLRVHTNITNVICVQKFMPLWMFIILFSVGIYFEDSSTIFPDLIEEKIKEDLARTWRC